MVFRRGGEEGKALEKGAGKVRVAWPRRELALTTCQVNLVHLPPLTANLATGTMFFVATFYLNSEGTDSTSAFLPRDAS